jgi:quercetin dioxygenase-like cupin family protein
VRAFAGGAIISAVGIEHITAEEMPARTEHRSAIEGDGFTATVARFEVREKTAGGWHHHGQHVIAYVISGSLRIESGPGGTIVTEPGPGDLVHIEPGTVHRETYEGEIAIVGFSSGSGPGRVDVDGPDPAE